MQDLNTVTLGGKILCYFRPNEKMVILKVNCGQKNIVEVICYKYSCPNIDDFAEGDSVSICGNVQSSYVNGKHTFGVIANNICKTKTLVMQNSVHVCGELIGMFDHNVFCEYHIKCEFNGHTSTFPVTIYKTTNDYSDIRDFEVGNRVYAGCSVQFFKKEQFDKKVYKQNLITSAIHKVS